MKFTWVIKNFSSLRSETCSETFVIDGCKWYLSAYPKGTENDTSYFSVYLCVADYKTLHIGWKRHTKCRLTVVNQLSDKLSRQRVHRKTFVCGCAEMILLTKLDAKKGGFVVNDEVKIIVETDVLESDVTQPLKKTKLNHDGVVDVNRFQVLLSQAEYVRLIFKKHPDMTLEFRAENQHLRTSCINLLLNLIETLCQSLQHLSIDDLNQAEKTLPQKFRL